MSAEGTVYDLGYTPHEGVRLGRAGAMRAMIVDGTRRSLGLRRKPWAKVLPWGLIGAAIVPAAWFIALTFLVGGFDVEDMGPFADPSEFFEIIGTLAMLFVALITPTLLIPDKKHGVLSIYASRPIRAQDYLAARAATVVGLTLLFMLIPQTILYVGISSLNENGIWAGLTANSEEIVPILGTTAAMVGAYVAPAVLVSLYAGRVAIATGVYVVAMFMSGGFAEAIPLQSDLLIYKVLAPLSLYFNPITVRDWLFDDDGAGLPLGRVDLDPWVAVVMIIAVAVLAGALSLREYRKDL